MDLQTGQFLLWFLETRNSFLKNSLADPPC
jgi:hypothetical protein